MKARSRTKATRSASAPSRRSRSAITAPIISLALQRPSGNVLDLLIDKGKYFNCILDDVMDVQSDLNLLSMWSDDAAEQMKITIDTAVLLSMKDQATAVTNRGATAGKISANINLGVTSTGPLALVARSPQPVKSKLSTQFLDWVRRSTSRISRRRVAGLFFRHGRRR